MYAVFILLKNKKVYALACLSKTHFPGNNNNIKLLVYGVVGASFS